MENWFAVKTDGTIAALGQHPDFHAADEAAGDETVWLLCQETADEWVDVLQPASRATAAVLDNLLAWERVMGGFESPAWAAARRLHARLPRQPADAGANEAPLCDAKRSGGGLSGSAFAESEIAKAAHNALEALMNVPCVSERFDQQHASTHREAYLRLKAALGVHGAFLPE